MSTIYNGQGSLVSPTVGAGTRASIASSTNASPIVVTFGSAPGYITGDTIEIEGHTTNTAANGQWQVTKTGSTTYALNNSTGNGVGGATGYAIDYELSPPVTIPANGELADMGPLGAALEGIANPAPALYRLTGKWRLYDTYLTTLDTTYWTTWSSTTLSSNTPSQLTSAGSLFSFSSPAPVVNPGDMFDFSFTTCYNITGIGGTQEVAIYPAIAFDGGTPTRIPGITTAVVAPSGATQVTQLSVNTLVALSQFSIPAQSHFDVFIYGNLGGTPTNNVLVQLYFPYSISIKHYRPN
jgi:hypothetical protein